MYSCSYSAHAIATEELKRLYEVLISGDTIFGIELPIFVSTKIGENT
jgi:hypothetical protein